MGSLPSWKQWLWLHLRVLRGEVYRPTAECAAPLDHSPLHLLPTMSGSTKTLTALGTCWLSRHVRVTGAWGCPGLGGEVTNGCHMGLLATTIVILFQIHPTRELWLLFFNSRVSFVV